MNDDASLAPTHKLCPWWMGYLIDNPLRRLLEPAEKDLAPFVSPGMAALDVGCGFGHYTLALARLVGGDGTVTAADVQRRMLDKTMERAQAAGLGARVRPHLCAAGALALPGDLRADVAVAGNVLHEMPDPAGALRELRRVLSPEGLLYVTEPAGHVRADRFQAEIDLALEAGFRLHPSGIQAGRRRRAVFTADGAGGAA